MPDVESSKGCWESEFTPTITDSWIVLMMNVSHSNVNVRLRTCITEKCVFIKNIIFKVTFYAMQYRIIFNFKLFKNMVCG